MRYMKLEFDLSTPSSILEGVPCTLMHTLYMCPSSSRLPA